MTWPEAFFGSVCVIVGAWAVVQFFRMMVGK